MLYTILEYETRAHATDVLLVSPSIVTFLFQQTEYTHLYCSSIFSLNESHASPFTIQYLRRTL